MALNLSGLLKTAGAGFTGYGQDKSRIAGEELQKVQLARQQKQDAIAEALRAKAEARPAMIAKLYGAARAGNLGAQGELLGESAAKYSDFDPPAPKLPERPQLVLGKDGAYVPANVRTGLGPDGQPVKAFKAPVKPELTEVETPDGKRVLAPKVAGLEVPGPANTGTAAIRTKIADNTTQLAVLDDALASLSKHPDAVGLTRGLPVIGTMMDQRNDPEGVGTRALIANIGSLQIHTRTGANMNVREEPRLAPFVPGVNDTPEAIREKLMQLRKFIQIENDALGAAQQRGGGSTKPPAVSHTSISDDDFARAWKAGKRTDAEIATWVAANPGGL